MRIVLPGVLLFILIASCGTRSRVPKGILPPEKMEDVLWDMFQADVFLKDFMLKKDSTLNDTTSSKGVYEKVFQFNKTSRQQFDTSFAYYQRHPKLLKEVLDSIYVKKQRVVTIPHPQQPGMDSTILKRIKNAGAVE